MFWYIDSLIIKYFKKREGPPSRKLRKHRAKTAIVIEKRLNGKKVALSAFNADKTVSYLSIRMQWTEEKLGITITKTKIYDSLSRLRIRRHQEIECVYLGSSWTKRHEFSTYPSTGIQIHTAIPDNLEQLSN